MNHPEQATGCAEGTIRRLAGELRNYNQDLELQANRLMSVEVRMFPTVQNNPVDTIEKAPEPVRNDLEEMQHQISEMRRLTDRVGASLNVLVEL